MKIEHIQPDDWMRVLIGEVPGSYFVELLIRAFIVYLILMVSMRLMGKRMSSQMSRNEMAALVSLAAAVGVPMMAPDRGVLPAVVIAFVLVAGERMIAAKSCKDPRFESFAQGDVSALVNDGVINIKELNKVNISHERLLAQLRWLGVLQLGTVSRLYMEASGGFTLVKNPQKQAGLSILPPWDHEMRDCFVEHPEQQICVQCGLPKHENADDIKCRNCDSKKWVTAVTEVGNG